MPETEVARMPDQHGLAATNGPYKIVIGGAGGHGVLVFGRLLAVAGMKRYGRSTFVPVYDPEIHGSPVNAFVIVSTQDIVAPVSTHYDLGILFDSRAANEHAAKVPADGRIYLNGSAVSEDFTAAASMLRVPATAEAIRLGNVKLTNMFMLGAFLADSNLFSTEEIVAGLEMILPAHRHSLIPDNLNAVEAGWKFVNG
jgi:2-oxoglutarate ferredoxin oxidoreductase subunit gamma